MALHLLHIIPVATKPNTAAIFQADHESTFLSSSAQDLHSNPREVPSRPSWSRLTSSTQPGLCRSQSRGVLQVSTCLALQRYYRQMNSTETNTSCMNNLSYFLSVWCLYTNHYIAINAMITIIAKNIIYNYTNSSIYW